MTTIDVTKLPNAEKIKNDPDAPENNVPPPLIPADKKLDLNTRTKDSFFPSF